MMRRSYDHWNTKLVVDTFTCLERHQSFQGVSEEEIQLAATSYNVVPPSPTPTLLPKLSKKTAQKSQKILPPLVESESSHAHKSTHPFDSTPSFGSTPHSSSGSSIPSANTPPLEAFQPFESTPLPTSSHRSPINVDVHSSLQALESKFEEGFNKLYELINNKFNSLEERVNDMDRICKLLEKDHVTPTPLGSLIQRIKLRQGRKRKFFTSPFISGQRKKPRPKKEMKVTQESEVPTQPSLKIDKPNVENVVMMVSEDIGVAQETLPQIDLNVEMKPKPAAEIVLFPLRGDLPKEMLDCIDTCCAQCKDRDDIIFTLGNIMISRSHIDDLLNDQCLHDVHIDAFAYMLSEKTRKSPGVHVPYLYVSSLHWYYAKFKLKEESKMYISHVTKEAVSNANLILIPVFNNEHWILMVGDLNKKMWFIYDSLPNPMHKAITLEVIKLLADDTKSWFKENFRKWPVKMIEGVPIQTNNVDCGMFVCKYMESVVLADAINWDEEKHWQQRMNYFRAKFAYQLLSTQMCKWM